MMVMMANAMLMVAIGMILMVMMLMVMMLMFMLVIMMITSMNMVMLLGFNFFERLFNLLNPCGRGYGFFVIEEMCVEEFIEVYVAIIAVDDFGLRLDCADDIAYMSEVGRRNV